MTPWDKENPSLGSENDIKVYKLSKDKTTLTDAD
jgi:hypothetical protein